MIKAKNTQFLGFIPQITQFDNMGINVKISRHNLADFGNENVM